MKRSMREKAWEAKGLYAGVDEVGVSPIAGPLTACAVILPPGIRLKGVRDSKLVKDHAERCELAEKIKAVAIDISFGEATPHECSNFGLAKATVMAMSRAVLGLEKPPRLIVSDYHAYDLSLPPGTREEKYVKGDRRYMSISAASILAKVKRDTYMKGMSIEYPEYHWETNVGYRSRDHWEAIRAYGLTPLHRMRFIKKALRPEESLSGAQLSLSFPR